MSDKETPKMKTKRTAVIVIAIVAAVAVVMLAAHLTRGFDFVGAVARLHGR
jgi:hypothetical protein